MSWKVWVALGGIGWTIFIWFLNKYVERIKWDKELDDKLNSRLKGFWTEEMCTKCQEACMKDREGVESTLLESVNALQQGQEQVVSFIQKELRDRLHLGDLIFLELLEANPDVNQGKVKQYRRMFENLNSKSL